MAEWNDVNDVNSDIRMYIWKNRFKKFKKEQDTE